MEKPLYNHNIVVSVLISRTPIPVHAFFKHYVIKHIGRFSSRFYTIITGNSVISVTKLKNPSCPVGISILFLVDH